MNKVYLNAYNATCSLGSNIEEIIANIEANKSGILPANFFFDEEKKLHVSKIPESNRQLVPRKGRFFHDLCTYYIKQLVESSHIDLSDENTLLLVSTTKGDIDDLANNEGNASLHELAIYFKQAFNCAHKPIIISNACISGVLALTFGHDLIKTQRYKRVVICAADLLSNFVVSGFNILQAISPEPCKPYDKNRKGVSLGEGCAVVLISDTRSSIEILAGATSNDANHISGPSRDGSGLNLAIKKAMEYSQIDQVDCINSHGTATLFNDEMESLAFASLQMQNIPLNSLKGYFGHTLGAAGLLESLISVEMMKRSIVYKSLGLEELGTTKELNVMIKNTPLTIHTLLKTASGFGGCNAAILFQKHD